MPAIRKTPTSANGGSDVGIPYTNAVDIEIETLFCLVLTELTSIGGSANAITASSDLAQVGPIASYVRPMSFWLTPASDNTSTVTINIDGVGAKAVVDKDNVSLAAGALKANRQHLIKYDGTSFRVFSSAPPSNPPTPAPDMIVQEQQAAGTAAGGFTSGSFVTRALNTAVRNVISGASLVANVITLPAGTYAVEWSAPAAGVNVHQTRLFNVTDSAVIETGTSESSANTGASPTRSLGNAVFTLTSSKGIRLDHQCGTTVPTSGLGKAASFGAHEVYSWVNIWKTA